MTIGVGVVGTGYWGKNLLRNLHALGALAAFCDSNETARTAFSAEYPTATPYADIDGMLADRAVDAVVIATPAVTHGVIARAALEAGKHVFMFSP